MVKDTRREFMGEKRAAVYCENKDIQKVSFQDKLLRILYKTAPGRVALNVLIRPVVSRTIGALLDTRPSAVLISSFVRKNHIDMSECEKNTFVSFNDFFKRRLKVGSRPICQEPGSFVSPCDGKLTVYDIEDSDQCTFNIKDSEYALDELLRDERLASRYKGGTMWLFRLCVDDYHRYIYNVEGKQSHVRRIEGLYHTVNPIASDIYKIYKENTREYCLIKTKEMGTIVHMEVGAMFVGRIENSHMKGCMVNKGQEKGNFAYGGSTIIILTQKGSVAPLGDISHNSGLDIETQVRQGQKVGTII